MNAGSLSRVISVPLMNPQTVPARMQTTIPAGIARASCGYWPLIVCALVPERWSITSPPQTAEKKRMPPIDRSIPAVTITNVSPIASRTTSEVLSAICSRFVHVRNVPDGVESTDRQEIG